MIDDDEVRTNGLVALSVAAAALLESQYDELVTVLPENADQRRVLFERLRQLGLELVCLADAGLVLLKDAGSRQAAEGGSKGGLEPDFT